MDTQNNHNVFDTHSKFVAAFLLISFLGLGYSLSTLPEYTPPPDGYNLSDRQCITDAWKLGLVLTHVLVFVLIPVAMNVFYTSLTAMRLPKSSVFASQLGLAFIMVSIASEIGWHVTQCWYYTDEFTMLNFMFYFFLLSGFALWSDGLLRISTKLDKALTIVFAIFLVIVSVLYPLGAAANNTLYKIPIYIALTAIFAVLTFRGYLLLFDWRVVFFPIFSVVVNLCFVWLLQSEGGNPYTDPKVASNAFYHIAHDLLGTEAGVLIFTILVYFKGRKATARGSNSLDERTHLLGSSA